MLVRWPWALRRQWCRTRYQAQDGQVMGSKLVSRKVLGAIWVLAAIGGIALFEWDMTPGSGRYKASGQSAGPGPARYLVLREWRRNTDYQFVPSAERKRHTDSGLEETYQLATDK